VYDRNADAVRALVAQGAAAAAGVDAFVAALTKHRPLQFM
jgi:6-phosphogluconate dehydrogenase (decarboxylating)